MECLSRLGEIKGGRQSMNNNRGRVPTNLDCVPVNLESVPASLCGVPVVVPVVVPLTRPRKVWLSSKRVCPVMCPPIFSFQSGGEIKGHTLRGTTPGTTPSTTPAHLTRAFRAGLLEDIPLGSLRRIPMGVPEGIPWVASLGIVCPLIDEVCPLISTRCAP